jgi:hypothetical protein
MGELLKKLNYKDQAPCLVLGRPPSLDAELGAMAEVDGEAVGGPYSFCLIFCPMMKDLLAAARLVLAKAGPEAVVWLAYPKQGSKASDLNRDVCFETLLGLGLRAVRQVSVDEDWSAMRYKRA